MSDWIGRIKRAGKKSPGEIAERIGREVAKRSERYRGPRRAARLTDGRLLERTGAPDAASLIERLRHRPFVTPVGKIDSANLDRLTPGVVDEVLRRAAAAASRTVDILGSGPVTLAAPHDWSADYRSGHRWAEGWAEAIDYMNPERPSDVKVPWELSRQQWLIPLGQAYLLTGDEVHAEAARSVVEEWIDRNPYGMTINWAIAMEVALRAITYTWLFHAFAGSKAWDDETFAMKLLRTIWLHGDYIERHLEKAYINGNHYLSNATGLSFLGLFFGEGDASRRWAETGWRILEEEIDVQIYADGVDYEASAPYHRLVAELFLYPALYRERLGVATSAHYRDRVTQMIGYIDAYSRPDGRCPNQGDADDARTLPFGTQGMNDHRYLIGAAVLAWNDATLTERFSGPRDEVAWLVGVEAAEKLPDRERHATASKAFPDGGSYLLNGARSQVFIDAGPVGLLGYGGHGHNDSLGVEVYLADAPLFADGGSYVYTASYEWHNRFRSTSFHNTPKIDDEEINRYVDPMMLWSLHDDAKPHEVAFTAGDPIDRFDGAHTGYHRLADPVTPRRTVALDKENDRVAILDRFDAAGEHRYVIPYHLDPEAKIATKGDDHLIVESRGVQLTVGWRGEGWNMTVEPSWHSPSYGVKIESVQLRFVRDGRRTPLLLVAGRGDANDLLAWGDEVTR